MEKYELRNDIRVFCVTASSFPDGIMDAFLTLKDLGEEISKRPFWGISYKNKEGLIVYKAAVLESFEGEGEQYDLEVFVISKGIYLTETIRNFKRHTDAIGSCFQMLLSHPELDARFPCVEWYNTEADEVVCMVRVKE